MQDPVEFLRSAAARVRQLAPAAPEVGERLNALADELEAEARSLESGNQPGTPQPGKDQPGNDQSGRDQSGRDQSGREKTSAS